MTKNSLSVRGLDSRIIEQLKARARARRRSLEAELREILIQASGQPLVLDALAEADRIAAMTPRQPAQIGDAVPLQAGAEP